MPVAFVGAVVGALIAPGADQRGQFGLDQLLADETDRFSDQIEPFSRLEGSEQLGQDRLVKGHRCVLLWCVRTGTHRGSRRWPPYGWTLGLTSKPTTLRDAAREVTLLGGLCLVPDWQSDDSAEGPRNLLESLSFAQSHVARFGGDPGRISLGGWSLGANAAADLVLHPEIAGGWLPNAFVGLAGGYGKSPFSHGEVIDRVTNHGAVPVLLMHGSRDEVVPPSHSTRFYETLHRWDWPAALRDVNADHAGILGTRYDADLVRCIGSTEPDRVRSVELVARWLFDHVSPA